MQHERSRGERFFIPLPGPLCQVAWLSWNGPGSGQDAENPEFKVHSCALRKGHEGRHDDLEDE